MLLLFLFSWVSGTDVQLNYGQLVTLDKTQLRYTIQPYGNQTLSFTITMSNNESARRICYENYLRIESHIGSKSRNSFLRGICSKQLIRKQFFTCGEEEETIEVYFYNIDRNPFTVKIESTDHRLTDAKPRQCGSEQLIPSAVRCAKFKPQQRIIGGMTTKDQNHPWFVRVNGNSCGGTIIGQRHVLTAGHCCGLSSIKIMMGGTYSTRKQAITSKKTIHPDYNDETLENDICILHFDEDLPLDKNHNMACLPNPSDQPAPGTDCYIAGYGYTEYDEPSSQPDMLMETSVPIMDYDTCAQWFHIEQSERPKRQAIQYVRDSYYDEQNRQSYQIDHFTRTDIICAGAAYGQRDACQGDSGGPLICITDNKPIVQGVVSWGVRCGERLLPGKS